MTQYIDIDAFDDDEVDKKDGGDDPVVEKPMSMGQLDMELAKLMSNSGSQSTSNNGMTAMELTMALCNDLIETSVGEEDAISLPEDEVKTATFSTPQFLRNNSTAENSVFDNAGFQEYDDYDVDAAQEIAEYNFHELLTTPNADAVIEEEIDTERWDGEGLFQADVDQEVKLTKKQEKYLKCYQTMYDDEKVNTDLLLEVLHYINKSSNGEGAILVFLPGWQEISEVSMLLEDTVPFNNRSKFMILPLHSGIPSQDQRKVLRRPPTGCRKIVLRFVCLFVRSLIEWDSNQLILMVY